MIGQELKLKEHKQRHEQVADPEAEADPSSVDDSRAEGSKSSAFAASGGAVDGGGSTGARLIGCGSLWPVNTSTMRLYAGYTATAMSRSSIQKFS